MSDVDEIGNILDWLNVSDVDDGTVTVSRNKVVAELSQLLTKARIEEAKEILQVFDDWPSHQSLEHGIRGTARNIINNRITELNKTLEEYN